jgi:hypothetical protein
MIVPLAPLHVEVYCRVKSGADVFDTKVGPHGKVYELNFLDLINLIKARGGRTQKRLEYRR